MLCEKPLAATAAEARAMFDAARAHGVHLVEGYPYRAQPQTLKLRELLQAGVIGEVRLMQAAFGFTLGAGENIRLNPQLAGGALMDVGAYPVSLARMVAGRAPLAYMPSPTGPAASTARWPRLCNSPAACSRKSTAASAPAPIARR